MTGPTVLISFSSLGQDSIAQPCPALAALVTLLWPTECGGSHVHHFRPEALRGPLPSTSLPFSFSPLASPLVGVGGILPVPLDGISWARGRGERQ